MDSHLDRRSFLRRAAAAALVAPAVSVLGCRPEDALQEAAAGAGLPRSVTRPILVPWERDTAYIAAPPHERPVAYMSMGRMEIYIDWEFRDRLQYLLGAHISVSTGVWRVPLPGDSPSVPITPGDEEREFEEIEMRYWDAAIEPTEGDLRILRGGPVDVSVEVSCVPVSGGGAWLNGGPWDLLQCGPPDERLCREDLMEIGTGLRFADRECTRPAGSVRFVTWACREPATFSGA